VSSVYRFLCLSHDPAIVIDQDLTLGDIASAKRSHPALEDHQDCDIIAGRFSYPLVEAGCFGGMQMEGATGCKGCHSGIIWTDADWLRLLDAAAAAGIGDDVLSPLTRCWPLDRLRKLRREIRLPDR
jgi:hypothetical protein